MNKMKNIVPFLIATSFAAQAQTLDVDGVVSTSTTPVQFASVTFIDQSDTSKQFFALTDTSGNYRIDITTSVSAGDNLPTRFELQQNYPNPFSSSTAISYTLNIQSAVEFTIYNILGRKVKTYTPKLQAAGAHGILWDGRNNSGERVAPGIYFYKLQAEGETQIKKMVFGFDEGNAFIPTISSSQTETTAKRTNVTLPEGNYTVHIENTDSTSPAILPQQFDDVVVQNDTTLNFDVALSNAAVVCMDDTRQTIRGFGAANILNWRPDMTAGEIEKAFGTDDGQIGFTILRLRIPPNTNGFGANIRTAQAAHTRGVKIIASPWSPPASMKTNNNIVGGRLRESSYAAYAAHLKSFADLMANNGVPLHAVSIQNEPDVSVTYESCDWNAAEMLKFVKENAPTIGTDIFVPESFNFNHTISDAILNDSTVASHVAIIGGHIYGGGLRSYPLAESKGKEIWMTEHLVLDTTWTAVLATGKEINDCMNAGMSAYIWWYIVRFYGPILEDGNVSKRGYVMSQFARFIRPGFVKVSATAIPRRNVFVTAYKSDSKVVIVALNNGSSAIDQSFAIRNGTATAFTPYVTSITKNCVQENEVTVSSGNFTATLDASSITTFVSE